MLIIYASETGNSFDLATQFYRQFYHSSVSFISFSSLTSFQPHQLYVFFIPTTGEGDFPSEMHSFQKKIMNKNFPSLQGVSFCVYGLGDRAYGESFNLAGRKLRQRLMMLQAKEVVEIGLGDEQDPQGYRQVYEEEWVPKVKNYLKEIEWKTQPLSKDFFQTKLKLKQKALQECKQCQIVQVELVSTANQHQVYWVTMLVKEEKIECGDVLNIHPHNSRQLVQAAFEYFTYNNLNDLGWKEKEMLNYLSCIANLHNDVNHSFFMMEELPSMVSTSMESNLRKSLSEKLLELGKDYSEYFNYIKRYKRNVMEVIKDFSLEIPLSKFVEAIGIIFPRKYSIAKISNSKIHLLIKLDQYQINKNRVIKGLCTTDLTSQIKQQCKIRYATIIKHGELQYIPRLKNNLVLVSLGTGIAPFLSILHEARKGEGEWKIILFHSSRTTKETYIDDSLFEQLVGKGILVVYQSITRQNVKEMKEKGLQVSEKRVQLVFEEKSEQVMNFINEDKDYKIMVCGPKQVKTQIQAILIKKLALDTKRLKKKKQFCAQNW